MVYRTIYPKGHVYEDEPDEILAASFLTPEAAAKLLGAADAAKPVDGVQLYLGTRDDTGQVFTVVAVTAPKPDAGFPAPGLLLARPGVDSSSGTQRTGRGGRTR